MITRITGVLNRVLEEEIRLQVGPFEYQVLVAEFVRRTLQTALGHELTFHTSHFFDGNPMQGKVVPRLLGFLSEQDLDFFELFCTVDKIGTRKALKALIRPVREVADAIQRQDSKWLTTLPGVGGPTAEKIIATLRRKVTRYALMSPEVGEGAVRVEAGMGASGGAPIPVVVDGNMLEEAYQALMSIGHSPSEARDKLDKVLTPGRRFGNVQELLLAIYQNK